MSAREQFLNNRWITNPKHMPLVLASSTALAVKTAYNASAVPSATGFYTALATEGAQGAITVADTYITLAELSGSGFLFNVVSPTHSAAFRPSIRITRDGVTSTLSPTADAASQRRLLFGPYTLSKVTLNEAYNPYHMLLPNSYADTGFNLANVGGVTDFGSNQAFPTMINPAHIMAFGFAALRFEQSLKVEVKASLLSATATDKQCACTYKLDI